MKLVNTLNFKTFNPLNAELNSICQPLALLGAHHIGLGVTSGHRPFPDRRVEP